MGISIVNPDVVRGSVPTKKRIEARVGRLQYLFRMVRHPTEGMAAKGYHPIQIQAAEQELVKLIGFYQELLTTW